jgi:hypothetical protein
MWILVSSRGPQSSVEKRAFQFWSDRTLAGFTVPDNKTTIFASISAIVLIVYSLEAIIRSFANSILMKSAGTFHFESAK